MKVERHSEFYYYMKSSDELVNHLSDGAHWAALEDAVVWWNLDKGTNWDPHDTVESYLEVLNESRV